MPKSKKKKQQKRTKRRMAKKQTRLQRLKKKVTTFCRKHIWPVLYVVYLVMLKIVENYDNIKSMAKDILG